MERTDVLVVGAGPSGLVAATLLAHCGVSVRILDRKPGLSGNSRAAAVQARSLEVFAQMGVAEELASLGRHGRGLFLHTEGGIVRLDVFGEGWLETAWPYVLLLEQDRTEAALARRLETTGPRIEWQRELVEVAPAEDAVVARVRGPDGAEERVAARFLVAADGASSTVRSRLGVPFAGGTYEQRFAVADVRATGGRLDPEHLNLNLNAQGVILLVPLTRPGIFRLVTTLPDALVSRAADPSFEDVRRHVEGVFPGGLRVDDPQWFDAYRIHSRSVARFRHGRVCFAGDAAHVHSPVGGQGMNTGIQDAHGLAFRLAGVLRGQLPDAALDTWHEERHRVAETLLRTTDRVFQLVDRRDPVSRLLRVHVYPRLAGAVLRVPAMRRLAAGVVSELAIRHERGMLAPDAGERFPAAAPAPGARFPWAVFRRGAEERDTPALLDYRRHHLLVFGRDVPALAAAQGAASAAAAGLEDALAVHGLTGGDDAAGGEAPWWRCEPVLARRLLGDGGPAAFLVRPDGYVGLRTRALEPPALAARLRDWFAGRSWRR